MPDYRVVQSQIDELCDELRPLLNAELGARNVIFETWKGNWTLNKCLYIMLEFPFRIKHEPLPDGLRLSHVNDPYQWKDEIICVDRTNHVLACHF